MENYILRGRNSATGETVYWTGRAGQGYASPDIAEAFPCTREYAERRMALFNSTVAVIKWTSVVEVCK